MYVCGIHCTGTGWEDTQTLLVLALVPTLRLGGVAAHFNLESPFPCGHPSNQPTSRRRYNIGNLISCQKVVSEYGIPIGLSRSRQKENPRWCLKFVPSFAQSLPLSGIVLVRQACGSNCCCSCRAIGAWAVLHLWFDIANVVVSKQECTDVESCCFVGLVLVEPHRIALACSFHGFRVFFCACLLFFLSHF